MSPYSHDYECSHLKIHQELKKGVIKYYFDISYMFDSIPELIKYYQKVPLFAVRGIYEFEVRGIYEFEEVLTFAVPRKVSKFS